jgi:hypothetical protein
MARYGAQSGLSRDQAIGQRPQEVEAILAAHWRPLAKLSPAEARGVCDVTGLRSGLWSWRPGNCWRRCSPAPGRGRRRRPGDSRVRAASPPAP